MRICRRAERFLCPHGRCEPGHVRLQVTAAAARSLARQAVVDDHDVSKLGTHAVRAAERTAVRDHAAAETGSEREHDDVVVSTRDARVPLADRSGVRIVVETDRQAKPLRHVLDEREVGERQVHALHDHTLRQVDRRRHSERDRGDLVCQQLRDRGLELVDDRSLRVVRCRTFVPADDLPLGRDDARENLRSADVDPDRKLARHGQPVPYPGEWPPLVRSRTASTRAVARKGRCRCRRASAVGADRAAAGPTSRDATSTAAAVAATRLWSSNS